MSGNCSRILKLYIKVTDRKSDANASHPTRLDWLGGSVSLKTVSGVHFASGPFLSQDHPVRVLLSHEYKVSFLHPSM